MKSRRDHAQPCSPLSVPCSIEDTAMIELKTGDILQANVEALVNPVNCLGVMGRGLALQFKLAFPENFAVYAAACRSGDVRPGHMLVFETGSTTKPKYIINFPTKRHWRDLSRLEDIEAGLAALRDEIERRCIRSIAVPALGTGLGGLPWDEVHNRIEAALGNMDETVILVFEPRREAAADSERRAGEST